VRLPVFFQPSGSPPQGSFVVKFLNRSCRLLSGFQQPSSAGFSRPEHMLTILAQSLAVAGKAIANVFAVCVAGAYAAHHGIMDVSSMQRMSQLMLAVLFPGLALSFFSSFSPQRIVAWCGVALIAMTQLGLGFLLGRLAGSALCIPRPYSQLMALVTALGNAFIMPLVMLKPMAATWSLAATWDEEHPDEESIDVGRGVVAMYSVIWFVFAFAFGRPYARACLAPPPPTTPAKGVVWPPTALDATGRALVTSAERRRGMPTTQSKDGWLACCTSLAASTADPVIICVLIAMGIGCVAPVKRALLEGGALDWLGDAWTSLGQCGSILNITLLGASLWRSRRPPRQTAPAPSSVDATMSISLGERAAPEEEKADELEPSVSMSVKDRSGGKESIARVSVWPPPRETGKSDLSRPSRADESSAAFAALPQVRTSRLSLADIDHSVLVASRETEAGGGQTVDAVPLGRLVLGCILTNYVAKPAICLPLTYLATETGILPFHPMLLLVLHLEAAMPPATTVLAIFAVIGNERVTSVFAAVFLPMYVVSVVAISLVILIAVRYTLPPPPLGASPVSPASPLAPYASLPGHDHRRSIADGEGGLVEKELIKNRKERKKRAQH